MDQSLVFDQALIEKYDYAGPRYTSYPTAPQFHEQFQAEDYMQMAAASNASTRALSLYFHIPFCDTVCFYCACNKVVTKDRAAAAPYLARLYREIELHAALFDSGRRVEQLHWGGGTPTFISHDEMRELMRMTRKHFTLADDDHGEYSIEIDPREASVDTIKLLREIGFNRMSLGVQDFDLQVQKAVNRVQPEEQVIEVLQAARDEGYRSIAVDLIYGLPLQSVESFSATLERIIEVNPDRLSVFNYAHLPQRFMPQRRIDEQDLPSPQEKLEILHMTIQRLTEAGYVFIGMDHFARPDDELAIAQRDGTLYRNFQGYSTHADCDLIAMGVTSISMVGESYGQNEREPEAYYAHLDAGRLPIFRGIALSPDDLVRRDVITRLICHFTLDYAAIEHRWQIDFADYFSDALESLAVMAEDGLITLNSNGIEVLPKGKLLIRNVCMAFDRYLPPPSKQQGFSRVI